MMPTTTTFQNGQVLTSSALTPTAIDAIFQLLCCQMLGVIADLELTCNLSNRSQIISTSLDAINLQIGFVAQGANIPPGTTIVGIIASSDALLITLSNEATANAANEQVSFFDPVSNTRVKTSWQTTGAPAFGITDDVLFIRCVPEPSTYNLRDESWTLVPATQIVSGLKNRSYTRQWRISFVAYGPNSFDSIRLLRSMLLEDFPHDSLAASGLYLVPDTVTPDRVPELFEGEWWERVDWAAIFNEQVDESITVDIVASIPVVGLTSAKQNFNVSIQGE